MFKLEKHGSVFNLMDVYEEECKTSCIVASINIENADDSEKDIFVSTLISIDKYIDRQSIYFDDYIILNNIMIESFNSNKQLKLQNYLNEAVKNEHLKGDFLNVNLIDSGKDYFVVYVDYKNKTHSEFIEQYLNDILFIKNMFKNDDFGNYTHLCLCPYAFDDNGNEGLWNTLIFHTNNCIYDMFKHHFDCFK